jgi:xylulose-5-phosphate/fructose-6-phosphate phosphoketolase
MDSSTLNHETITNQTITNEASTHEKSLYPELLRKMDAYWRAANYLSVGQIYLFDNPLLKRPLTASDIKPMLIGTLGHDSGAKFYLRAFESHH